MLNKLLIVAWTLNIVFESALLLRMARQWNWSILALPLFYSFITYDLARSITMVGVWTWGTRTAYAYGFICSEPIDMALLLSTGIEAFGRRCHKPPTWTVYALIMGLLTLISYALPLAPDVVMARMFLQRSLVAFVVLSVLLAQAAYEAWYPNIHEILLIVYCGFDLVAYLSLVLFPDWGKTSPVSAPLLVMSGQACCYLAWALLFPRVVGWSTRVVGWS